MMRWWPLALIVLPAAASCELVPPRYVDPRIRTVTYSTDEVVPISIAVGYQLTVELGRGEHIENIAIGDNSGWLVTPNKRGDFFFIKPLDGAQSTNLTVITDGRTYLFELGVSSGVATPYSLRFRYDTPNQPDGAETAKRVPGQFRLSGSRAIKPAEMFDDGLKTYIILKPDQALPAIFAIGADGKEMLLNGAMREGRYVVDGLADKFVLRLDKQIVLATRKPKLKN